MRFIIMHRTNAHWEAGATPGPELIARVGALLGELAEAKVLLGAEGLRASSQGARLRSSAGTCRVEKGPFAGGSELPAGFTILNAASLEEAVEWASRQAKALGDAEIDVRPVTEPWDLGMVPRPPGLRTRRYMLLRKATAATEAGEAPPPEQLSGLARIAEEARQSGAFVAAEEMRPSARGRRYKNSDGQVTATDGPFAESKELIAGYVVVAAESLEEAGRLALRYVEAVGAEEVDVRELE